MDTQTAALVQTQSGVVGAGQLQGLGMNALDVRALLCSGELVRVRRGAYVDGNRWRQAVFDERYRLTVLAVMRSRSAPDEMATHHSALALHGVPLWNVDRRIVVLATDVQETTSCTGLRLMPKRALAGVSTVDGVTTLDLPDAVVTSGSMSVEAGVVAGDAALHSGACTVQELRDSAERLLPGLRGRRRVRHVLFLVDGAAESPGESRTRLLLGALQLPVQSQVEIRDDMGALVGRVDFLVAGRVVVEFDGAVKYGGATGSEALMAEKRREDRLRELGYLVIRVTWDELAQPQRVLSRIHRALLRQPR